MALSDLRLPDHSLQKLIMLAFYLDGGDEGRSQIASKLAKECNLSPGVVRHHLIDLCKSGWLEKRKSHLGEVSLTEYFLNDFKQGAKHG